MTMPALIRLGPPLRVRLKSPGSNVPFSKGLEKETLRESMATRRGLGKTSPALTTTGAIVPLAQSRDASLNTGLPPKS